MLGIFLALVQGHPLLDVYRYPPRPVEAQVQPTGGDSSVAEFFLTYPSLVQTGSPANDRVAAFYFVPRTPGRHPVVVILHALGSQTASLEQWIGREFAHRGLAALALVLPYHMMRKVPGGLWTAIQQGDADGILAAGVQAILHLRRALDWLETRAEIAPDRMGVVGISLGAIGGAIALGVDARVKADVGRRRAPDHPRRREAVKARIGEGHRELPDPYGERGPGKCTRSRKGRQRPPP